MRKRKSDDPKSRRLREQGALNPRADKVRDDLFRGPGFFDPRDLVQVKYEMVRRVQVDHQPVARAAESFGFSRPSFYQAQASLAEGGLPALVRRKPGPRHAHKLDEEVMTFLEHELGAEPDLTPVSLSKRIEERFGRKVHPRSVERALSRREKKRRTVPSR
jgi:transposase